MDQVIVVLFTLWVSTLLGMGPYPALVQAQGRTSTSTSPPPKEVIPTTCSSFYRNTRRSGAFMYGQFTIPVDSKFPKFEIQVKFSRQIQSLTFRQTKAKDINGHREFSIEALQPENGQIVLTSIVRVSRAFLNFSRMGVPRVNRIVYNGKTLCAVSGEPIVDETANDDSVAINVHTKSTKKKSTGTVTKVKPVAEKWETSDTSKSNNDFEDDEDEGFDVVV